MSPTFAETFAPPGQTIAPLLVTENAPLAYLSRISPAPRDEPTEPIAATPGIATGGSGVRAVGRLRRAGVLRRDREPGDVAVAGERDGRFGASGGDLERTLRHLKAFRPYVHAASDSDARILHLDVAP